MSDKPYTYIENLNDLITSIPAESIVSRTFYRGDVIKAVIFGFAEGQSLSEHSAAQHAIVHILSGEATLTLNGDTYTVGAGAWVEMPPRMRHSLVAQSPVQMLLLLIKSDEEAA